MTRIQKVPQKDAREFHVEKVRCEDHDVEPIAKEGIINGVFQIGGYECAVCHLWLTKSVHFEHPRSTPEMILYAHPLNRSRMVSERGFEVEEREGKLVETDYVVWKP